MPFTIATAQAILNKLLRAVDFSHATTLFLSIHTADPGENGANEFTGYDGDRPQITFAAPAGKVCVNTADIDFENFASQQTITHIGLWSAATGGNFWWGGALTSSTQVNQGQDLRFPASSIEAELDPVA